jgi:16S rRNA (uracil1498-N3)-methyltransferase
MTPNCGGFCAVLSMAAIGEDKVPAPDHRQAPRLFVAASLEAGAAVGLERAQAHYLTHVLRLKAGDPVLAFNGRDGEWLAALRLPTRKDAALSPERQTQPQRFGPDLHYLFAPLKHARLDYMVQKAVEMGASRLVPVITERTQTTRVNLDRMHANAVEAAEQCGLLAVPEIAVEEPLETALTRLEAGRTLVFCDEEAPQADPLAALRAASSGPLAVLIGPEGGFSERERKALVAVPGVVRLSLGPRVMRADTAAVAALALVQATLGDWRFP